MKFNIKKDDVKSVVSFLQNALLILVSAGCIIILTTRIKGEKVIQSEKETIEKLEKRVSTIEGLIMTQQIRVLDEEFVTPPQPQQPEYRETTKTVPLR